MVAEAYPQQLYIQTTTLIATDHGLTRAYHADCIEASKQRWRHPQFCGPRYTQAYAQHVPLARKPAGHWNRSAAKAEKPATIGFKRKATAPAREAPEPRSRKTCAVHPGASHTDAECLSQQRPSARRPQDTAGDSDRQGAARRP